MNIFEDPLISDPELRRIAGGITPMTVWRWRKAGILPPPLVLNRRNYSRKSEVDAALARAFGLTHDTNPLAA